MWVCFCPHTTRRSGRREWYFPSNNDSQPSFILTPRYRDTLDSWLQRYPDSLLLWLHDTVSLWLWATVILLTLCYSGTLTPHYSGTLTPHYSGTLTPPLTYNYVKGETLLNKEPENSDTTPIPSHLLIHVSSSIFYLPCKTKLLNI